MTAPPHLLFKPTYGLTFITQKEVQNLNKSDIKIDVVGEKAYFLSCIPAPWTLPYFVVSDELVNECRKGSGGLCLQFNEWVDRIYKASKDIGVSANDQVIIRSSAKKEGMDERGIFYSSHGYIGQLKEVLKSCITNICNDVDIQNENIPLIVQRYATPISAIGHLSNERRFYKEKRDWLGELALPGRNNGTPFKINLRNWREIINTKKEVSKQLSCNLTAHVSHKLKIPAAWAYERKLRLHFEWVWDGRTIFIVQADQENEKKGSNPSELKYKKIPMKPEFNCLRIIDESHANKFYKIKNVLTYQKLGLPTTKIYALDDQKIINEIYRGKKTPALISDLKFLVRNSLVIRMDIATEDLKKRQLLPRTNEVRELDDAINWLIRKCKKILDLNVGHEIVFLFHNFIPAVSSAFAFASPGERQVQIESLWGLPEGLYYNSHDKFIVDTKSPILSDIGAQEISNYKIREKINHKQFFVSPDKNGDWKTKILSPPYDWRRSVRRQEWIKKIALFTRKIANYENRPVSVMWFVEVPKEICKSPILPWYHEPFVPDINPRTITKRKKTPFDKQIIIRNKNDIRKLREEIQKPSTMVRRIRIQPQEEELLRDKDTLKVIGDLSKNIGAIILLEGGVLSHTYYQLLNTGAIVEVLHPFNDLEEKREFNKLVRDKIPVNIEKGGELVSKTKLTGEYLIKALKEKLIEESFEVFDAIDQDSIIGELADVKEIIDELLEKLSVPKNELEKRQKIKREKAGGFKDGLVLLQTDNPIPTSKSLQMESLFEEVRNNEFDGILPSNQIIIEKSKGPIKKWIDKREHEAATESIINVTIPVTISEWTYDSPEKTIDKCKCGDIRAVAKVRGNRKGAQITIEFSIFTLPKQLKLFDI